MVMILMIMIDGNGDDTNNDTNDNGDDTNDDTNDND